MRALALAPALACAAPAIACDTSVHGVVYGALDAQIDPACVAAQGHSDLAFIQTNIFAPSCSLSTSCHGAKNSDTGNLVLTSGMSWSQLVGQDAQSSIAMKNPHGDGTPWQRVVPGDPTNSYLMVLIDPLSNPNNSMYEDPAGYAGPLDPMVGSMPQSNPLLCTDKIDAIKAWIAAGAPAQ